MQFKKDMRTAKINSIETLKQRPPSRFALDSSAVVFQRITRDDDDYLLLIHLTIVIPRF